MLMGKLYAIMIYGLERSEGKILEFHWTALLNILVTIWIGCLALMSTGEFTVWTEWLGVIAVVIAIPVLFGFICVRGRKKAE